MASITQAQTLEDLDYEPFPDISRAIPELAAATSSEPRREVAGANTPIRPTPASPTTPSSPPVTATGTTPDPTALAAATLLQQAAELARAGELEASAALSRSALTS